jgi:hypothetical protein
MAVTWRAIETCVCAWFFAELESVGAPTRSAEAAFECCTAMFAPAVGEEPEHTKMREDLTALGRERFVAGWNYLLGVHDASAPGELHALLRRVFQPSVVAGYARRARRTGQA